MREVKKVKGKDVFISNGVFEEEAVSNNQPSNEIEPEYDPQSDIGKKLKEKREKRNG